VLALQASREAVRAAKSWQSGITVQTPNGGWSLVRTEYIECPSRYDRISVVHGSQPGSTHEVWFNGVHYQMVAGGAWAAIDAPLPAECGAGPELVSGGVLYGDLDSIERSGEVRPGKLTAALMESSCTWWDAASVKGEAPNYSVCLDENDHLPRKLRSAEHGETYVYTFTNWNATSVTLPRDIVATGP